MRAIAILLCLATVTANAQSGGYRAPPEDSLTPPPITSAPRDEPPPPPPATAAPEEEFLPPPPASPAASAEPSPPTVTPPPPPPPATVTPPPPPPGEPQRARPARPKRFTGPAESADSRAMRHSRYSAGSGGPTLVLTAGLSGLISGAMLGSGFSSSNSQLGNDGFTGAVIGGLGLGTAAILYQYFVPVGRREGLLVAGAASSSLVASLVVAHSERMSTKDRALLTFTAMQASIVGTLLLTAGGEDVSGGDAGLVGAMSLYGLLVTGLVEYIHAKQTNQGYNAVPVLLAPAIGMAVGGLLALPVELSSTTVFELTAIPLATGTVALLLGSRFADGVTVAKTVLVTMGGTAFLVGLIQALSAHSLEAPVASTSTFQAMPVPVVLPAGRRHEGLAAGAGLFMRF